MGFGRFFSHANYLRPIIRAHDSHFGTEDVSERRLPPHFRRNPAIKEHQIRAASVRGLRRLLAGVHQRRADKMLADEPALQFIRS